MIDVFETTPEEKAEFIIDMLERGYSYKQIMKECHVSPSTISEVKKGMTRSTDTKGLKQTVQISKETQALRLFNEGKTALEVAIMLDIATDYVFTIHERYLRLRGFDQFCKIYEHIKGDIQPFLQLFDLMKGLAMTPEQVAQQVSYGNNLPYLECMYTALSNDVQVLFSHKHYFQSQLNLILNQTEGHRNLLLNYDKERQVKASELQYLDSEIIAKKNFVRDFDNNEGMIRIREAAKRETQFIIKNNQMSCAFTLSATLEAIRRYPNNQTLIYDIAKSRNNSTESFEQSWAESHSIELLQLMQNVQNEIAEQIAHSVISTEISPQFKI